jgi:hypothetical protein
MLFDGGFFGGGRGWPLEKGEKWLNNGFSTDRF